MNLPDQPVRAYVMAGVLALVLAGAGVWSLLGDRGGGGSTAQAPVEWSPDIGELVLFVEHTRGAVFQRPVGVDAVDEDEFAELMGLGPDGLNDAAAAHVQQAIDFLRALGLVTDRRDDEALVEAVAERVLAQEARPVRYLVAQDRIVVLADDPADFDLADIDTVTKIELVGALAEAWHAQHLGLTRASRLDRSAAGPRAVAAGVGPALIERYLVDLPPRELAAWERHVEVGRDDGPEAVIASFLTHSEDLGEALVALALADTVIDRADPTWRLVNGLLRSPPRTELELIQPWAAIDGFERVAVPTPLPEQGSEVISQGQFGASSLYVALALRVDPREALATSLGWAGDEYILSHNSEGLRCLDLTLEGRDGDASDRYEAALVDWAASAPRQSDVTVDRDGRTLTLHSCEPRVGAATGIAIDPQTAVSVAANRTHLLAELRLDGMARVWADCTADRVIAGIPVGAIRSGEATPESQVLFDQLLDRSRLACRNM